MSSTLQELKDALHAARGNTPIPVQQVQQKQQETTEPVEITTPTVTPEPVEQAKQATQASGATPTPKVEKVVPKVEEQVAEVKEVVPQKQETVPTWQDIVNELNAIDNDNEEQKAQLKKKQRVATAIAALGDIATHAINVWGATNGYNAPIKGAPLTEAVTKQQQLKLADIDARLEKLKKLKLDAYKGRRSDLADQIKLADYYRRERESLEKSKLNELLAKKRKAEISWRNAKTEQDKEKHAKISKKYDAEIKNLEDQMAKRGTSSSSSKRTYTVDGVTYTKAEDAFFALPKEYQTEAMEMVNSISGNINLTSAMGLVIAKYNAGIPAGEQAAAKPENPGLGWGENPEEETENDDNLDW